MNWLPLYFIETFNMGLAASGFSGTVFTTVGVMLGITLGGYLSDWIAKFGLHQRLLLEIICIVVALPFPLVFIGPSRFLLISGSIFTFTFFRSLGQANSSPIICEVLNPRTWSTTLGFLNMANSIAAGAGVLLAGYLKSSFGLKGVFAGVSGIVLVAVLILVLGYFRYIKEDLSRQAEGSLMGESR